MFIFNWIKFLVRFKLFLVPIEYGFENRGLFLACYLKVIGQVEFKAIKTIADQMGRIWPTYPANTTRRNRESRRPELERVGF